MTGTARPIAVVTGGRRGIGFAIAGALAGAGYDIAITDVARLDVDQTNSLSDELKARGAQAVYLEADLADVASHGETVDKVVSRFGRLDCLVNNAGIGSIVRGDFLDLTPGNFDAVLDVNLRGTIFFTQAVAKAMLALPVRGPRTIINITSVSAELSSPERLDYCISKAGLSSFTRGLALRLAETGISVFEVRPGIIRTDMTAGVAVKYDALIGSGLVPAMRWGEPGDVGAICAALAGGGFGFATGSIINADGGLAIPRL